MSFYVIPRTQHNPGYMVGTQKCLLNEQMVRALAQGNYRVVSVTVELGLGCTNPSRIRTLLPRESEILPGIRIKPLAFSTTHIQSTELNVTDSFSLSSLLLMMTKTPDSMNKMHALVDYITYSWFVCLCTFW